MAVRKREWVTAKGEKKTAWIVDYKDQGGTRRLKTFSRKKDADAWQPGALVEVQQGVHTPDSESMSVERAGDLWIEACEANELERTTVDAYRQHLRLHILPFLRAVKLSQLTAPMVRDLEDKLKRGRPAPGERTGTVRSAAMVRRVRGSLGALLSDAVERGNVGRNVVRDLRKARKPGKEGHAERRQKGKARVGVDIPTREEIKAILGALEGRWRPILLTAIFTGLRASELRGLPWSDIDLAKGELHVRQRADRFNKIGAPKTDAGERTVPLTPMLVSELREWKLKCPKGALCLVFPTGTGAVEYYQNILTRGFMPAQVKAGVIAPMRRKNGTPVLDEDGKPVMGAKYGGLHALRHFFASWCINRVQDGGRALPASVVKVLMGHSHISVTLNTYTHLFPSTDDGSELAAAERALMA